MLEPGPMPLYFQLKNIIKNKIESGEFKGNDRLPAEEDICAEYNVSRATVRRALFDLELEGFIYRIRGKGTYVTDQEGLKQLSSKGTIENLIASARGTKLNLMKIKDIVPQADIVKLLTLSAQEKCKWIEAVRSSNEGPFSYANLYFPLHWGEMIPWQEYQPDKEFLLFLEEKIKTRLYRASQTIGVGLAGDIASRHLSLDSKAPVLMIRRVYFVRDGSPLFVSITHNRPDRYEYKVELSRN